MWKITEDADFFLEKLQLNQQEQDFISNIKNGKRYLHWLSSRVMLRELLETNLFIEILADEKGKPFLKNFPHKISISHSHDMAAVMISKYHEVGIDIEHIHPKVEKIAHKFLSQKELDELDPRYRTEHLIICWCAKEALFKLYAKGAVDFKQHLFLKNYDYKESGRMEAAILKEDFTGSFIVHFHKIEHYFMAYVMEEER